MSKPVKKKEKKFSTYNKDNIILEYVTPEEIIEYEKIRLLGTGTFSKVYECIEVETGEHFAIKQVSKNFLLQNNLREQFTKEVKIHFQMKHPNVVRLYKVFEDKQYIYMLMELSPNGTLAELIDRRCKLSEVETKYYLKNILEGLKYIHDQGIVHRDLKPANLVISTKMELKIADFGLASYIAGPKKRRKTFCGTPFFIAPEIFNRQEGHSFEVDYWSLGIILYTMLYGKCPFVSDNVEEVYRLIKEGKFEIDSSVSKEANDAICSLIEKEYSKRAGYYEAIESNFMVMRKNVPECLPISTLKTAPSESFISNFVDDSMKINSAQKHKMKVDKNVYSKDFSKSSAYDEMSKDAGVEYEYVKKWVNFSEKFGIGYILNNGIIGIYYNDRSKIVLSNFGITFHHISPKRNEIETYNILSYPKELEKKVKILDYFIKYLKSNEQLFKITENMPDNFEYIKNYKITKYAVLFMLSNGIYQMIFQDGTEIHIIREENDKKVIYIDQSRNRTTFMNSNITDNNVLKRLEHVQSQIANMKSN